MVLRHLPSDLASNQKFILAKSDDFELVQFLITSGGTIPTHEAQGEVVIHCIEGEIVLMRPTGNQSVCAGQLVYLSAHEPSSIQCTNNASLLVTIITAKQGPSVEVIG